VFDECIDRRDVYKVATIGDAYFVASGLPHATTDHSRQVCLLALDIQRTVENFTVEHLPAHRLRQRIGVHSGTTRISSLRVYTTYVVRSGSYSTMMNGIASRFQQRMNHALNEMNESVLI